MRPEHWEAVKTIYLKGIATRQATFQTEAPNWPDRDKAHLVLCRLVATKNNLVFGWEALSPVSSRYVLQKDTCAISPKMALQPMALTLVPFPLWPKMVWIFPSHIDKYRVIAFDYFITVCDHAQENCPYFPTQDTRFHQNFLDLAKATGTEGEIQATFCRVRDQMIAYSQQFVAKPILSETSLTNKY